jgi:Uma2 family endonuclease
MVQPIAERSYTADEVRAMQDESLKWPRYEVIDGELFVTPAPLTPHQMIVTELLLQLGAYLTPLGLRKTLFASPADITWGPRTLVQPDVFVVPPEEISRRWATVKTLRLAAEVLSPSSVRADRVRKRSLYMEKDVRAYWIVDGDARLVEVWTPGDERPLIVDDVLRWRVTPDAPEMVLPLGELFSGLPEGD